MNELSKETHVRPFIFVMDIVLLKSFQFFKQETQRANKKRELFHSQVPKTQRQQDLMNKADRSFTKHECKQICDNQAMYVHALGEFQVSVPVIFRLWQLLMGPPTALALNTTT